MKQKHICCLRSEGDKHAVAQEIIILFFPGGTVALVHLFLPYKIIYMYVLQI